MLVYILLFILLSLQLCDASLTARILKKGGRELNPIVAWFITRFGVLTGLLVPKALTMVLAALFLMQSPWALFFLVAVYVAVCYRNWTQYT